MSTIEREIQLPPACSVKIAATRRTKQKRGITEVQAFSQLRMYAGQYTPTFN